jgi:NADH-quinone oxidoreductase subunit H
MDFFFNLPIWLQAAIKGIAVIAVIFPLAAACSMAERKVSAWIQGRPGPNRAIVPWAVGIPFLGRFLQRLGVFHLMADGGKFVFKENVVPAHVNRFYYQLAPVIALIPALTTIVFVPFGVYWDGSTHTLQPLVLANLDVGILAVFAVGSLGV